MHASISARGLRKSFGSLDAVRGIDLTVAPGEVLGFLGPNGAGKSTTMRMLVGYLPPTDGTIAICGIDLAAASLAARRLVGYLPEGAPVYPDMTVAEFLRFVAAARGMRGAQASRAIDLAVERTHLASVLPQTIETLSKGFKRRVGLAQAIMHEPPVLILDEPTDGLDPNQKHDVRALIRRIAAEERGGRRTAIVLSTHILEEVEAVCTRAVIIDRGAIVFDGSPDDLERRAPANVSRNRLDHVFRMLTTPDAMAPGKLT